MNSANDCGPVDPRLPLKQERLIFESAALLLPTGIPNLILVASRVKNWVEPLLYRTILLRPDLSRIPSEVVGLPVFDGAHLLRISETNSSLLKHTVKDLFIGLAVDPSTAHNILTACTRVTHLFAQFNTALNAMPSLSALQDVRYLAVDVDMVLRSTESDALHPLLLNVRHLELLDFARVSRHGLCDRLLLMENLTHLTLNSPLHPNVSHAELQSNARLRCIETDYGLDWLLEVHTGEGYWTLADEFLEAQRMKQTDGESFPQISGVILTPFAALRYSISDGDRFLAVSYVYLALLCCMDTGHLLRGLDTSATFTAGVPAIYPDQSRLEPSKIEDSLLIRLSTHH
ncbi:hypothetical protein B0H14DRAFT_3486778 [Mycena olivaceomarginata]|nr:hypothetical protein B0H14DRAFT_3486778 [Mycena olivaceomarginata]